MKLEENIFDNKNEVVIYTKTEESHTITLEIKDAVVVDL